MSRSLFDQPASLTVGQQVWVIVEPQPVRSSSRQAVRPGSPQAAADLPELARRTDEALKSAREAFVAGGMTDDELAEFLEVETHAMRGIPYERE